MMSTNWIRQDLNSTHQPFILGLALSVIGSLGTA